MPACCNVFQHAGYAAAQPSSFGLFTTFLPAGSSHGFLPGEVTLHVAMCFSILGRSCAVVEPQSVQKTYVSPMLAVFHVLSEEVGNRSTFPAWDRE